MQNRIDLSIVIITLNEEKNLNTLLGQCPKNVEVIVLDSLSSDGTKDIAARHQVQFFQQKFQDYAHQKNSAINLATRGWILSLDADELPSPNAWREIIDIVQNQPKDSGWRIKRRQVFMNKVLHHGKAGDCPIRLFPKGKGVFEGEIHEKLITPAGFSIQTLKGELQHFSYMNLTDYFERFNRYTTSVAVKHHKAGRRPPSSFMQFIRFKVEFLWRYIFRLGFLDGYPGLVYALLGSVYVFVKYAKLRELNSIDAMEGKSKTP